MVELPPRPEVDRTRRGVLSISAPALLALLGLGPEYDVEVISVGLDGLTLHVDLVGGDLPEGNFLAKPVKLLCHVTPGQPVQLSWEHLPEKRWTREPASRMSPMR